MLPQTFRFIAFNNSGVDMHRNTGCSIGVSYMPWRFNSNGQLVYGTAITGALNTFGGGDILAISGSEKGSSQDNSSEVDLGLHGIFDVTHTSGTANGTVELYIEHSIDAGTTWPNDKAESDIQKDADFVTAIVFNSASGQKSTPFSI